MLLQMCAEMQQFRAIASMEDLVHLANVEKDIVCVDATVPNCRMPLEELGHLVARWRWVKGDGARGVAGQGRHAVGRGSFVCYILVAPCFFFD